jgi:hypothetical protein
MPYTLGTAAEIAANRVHAGHHEAGHAVAYLARGRTFRYATVRGRYNDGVVLWRPRRITPWDQAFVAAAGPIAEWHHAGMAWDDDRLAAELDDAEDCDESMFGSEPQDDLACFAEATAKYLPREMRIPVWRGCQYQVTGPLWPAVRAVAAALIESPRALAWREVAAVAGAVLPELAPDAPR